MSLRRRDAAAGRVATLRAWALPIQLAAALWTALSPAPALAYDHPLGDDDVREAYFLGQDVRGANSFLAGYTQSLPVPGNGPQIAEVELSTPYAQVVEASAQHTVGYSPEQAAADYRKRGDFLLVRVKVLFTPSYEDDSPDFWRQVSVGLTQDKRQMDPVSMSGEPIYTAAVGAPGLLPIGATVYARFALAGVKSEPVTVEAMAPGGDPVQVRFDLGELR